MQVGQTKKWFARQLESSFASSHNARRYPKANADRIGGIKRSILLFLPVELTMRMSFRVFRACAVALCATSPMIASAQVPVERVDTAMIEKIKEEGLQRSKVMETISYITDVHGPRLTGSPLTRKAGEWAKGQLTEWGLENAQLESWGPFGRGWTLEACSTNMVEPHFSQIIAYPKAWTPSTPKTVRGEPIYLEANTKEDLEKYRGKLGKAIVLISPPREALDTLRQPLTAGERRVLDWFDEVLPRVA